MSSQGPTGRQRGCTDGSRSAVRRLVVSDLHAGPIRRVARLLQTIRGEVLSPVHFSSKSVEWETPDKIIEWYGPFDLDVCATKENAKAPKFFTKETDGLKQNWAGKCWMNPPYGREIKHWVRKAADEATRFGVVSVTCLVPARTDTLWWHDYIWNAQTNAPHDWVRVEFIRGRLKFGGHKNAAPFPSAVVIFEGHP